MLPQKGQKTPLTRSAARRPSGCRALLACVKCKEKKWKCDNNPSGCNNCLRAESVCLVEDPVTRTFRPRNYIEILEKRVEFLESLLKERCPDLVCSDLFKRHAPERQKAPTTSPRIQHIINSDVHHSDPMSSRKAKNDSSRDDAVDKLEAKVGLLSLNAAGAEPQYLGSSSIFAFSRLINPSLRQVVSSDLPTGTVADGPENRVSVLPSPCLLPDHESAVRLSNVYFQNVNVHYPVLHEPTFRTWESMLLQESAGQANLHPDYISLIFLNMVFAVGALLLPQLGFSAERLYTSALMYIDDILIHDNLEAVQAILCCAIYSVRSPTGTSHWKLGSLALRQCIDLGYHRHTKHFSVPAEDLVRTELRKRVFWCAYVIETQAAVMLGRPLSVPYQEVDAEYPIDIDDTCITSTGLLGTPRSRPQEAPTTMTRAIYTFRMRRLLNLIHTRLYSKADPICSGNHDRQRDVANIRAKIEKWRTELPPSPPSHAENDLALFTSADWYDLEYNYTILQLCRAQILDLRAGGKASEDVFLECLRAAESICQSYRRQFLGKPTSCTWAALHELFLAGLTYLHCLWTTSSAARGEVSGPAQANSTCNDCTIALVIMAERWDVAAPYRDIFAALASRTLSMLGDKACAERLSDRDDCTEWMNMVAQAGVLNGSNGLLTGIERD
ncbi:putative transcriptional activator protein acu-15 [Aspergillus fijiensis CBS 313.89]|uniref:Putative transcriptional activator protein acu-15 n=1 Tax=Aspergillus fijiensis CBS 313.89 TaxID=1448319 RepID=A0A8G1VZN3_9EURO|nr:putative transcriptional activator protein acu-15 [Aspergillus fijiensis CBS 313.89]RAK78990.1 putative transcriptional activator protein acu-15 [Aspergillus fijiensis CBS 313.89]